MIKIALISDDEKYRKKIIKEISKSFPSISVNEVRTKKQFKDILSKKIDAVITEYEIRWGTGIKVLLDSKKSNPFIPVIMIIPGSMKEVAAEAMRFGLDDYILKDDLTKLPSALRSAIEKERMKEKEAMLSSMVENAKEAIIGVDREGRIIYSNQAVEEIFGWKRNEIIGKHMSMFAFDRKEQELQWKEVIKKGKLTFETVRKDRHGNAIPVLMTVVPVKRHKLFTFATIVDLRKIKEHEKKLEHLNELLAAIRGVNQIITKEKNIDKLLQECCNLLHRVKNYDFVCLSYGRKIYKEGEQKFYKSISKVFRKKEGKLELNGKHAFIMQIKGIKGRLCIISPKKFEDEEIELLKEVGEDISFAMHSIKTEKEKKKMQKKLEESERKYRMLVERANEGICIDDENEKIVFANRAYARILGYKRKELIGKDFISLVYEKDREKLKEEMKKRRKGKASKYEIRLVSKDGSLKTFVVSAIPLYKNGKFAGSLSINLDITEQKELERKFEAVFEGAMDAVFIEEIDGRIIDVNDAACKLLGYSREELKRMSVEDIVPEEIRGKLKEIIEEHLKKGGIRMEAINVHKDGRHIPVDVSTTPVEIGGKKRVVAIVRDISERKKMEEDLKESERKYRMLVENAHDAIYIITPDGFEYVNPAFERLTGYTSEEICNKGFSFQKLIYESDRKMIEEREKARERGEKINPVYRFRIIRKDGSIRWVEATTVNIGGEKIRAMGILRDVTESVRAEKEIEKLANLHYLVGKGINESQSINELARKLLRDIKKIVEVDFINLFMYDKGILTPIVFYGYPKDFRERVMISYRVDEKQPWEAVKCVLERRERYIPDIRKHKPLSFNWDLYKKYKAKELFTLPLITRNELYGVLQVINIEKNPLSHEKRKLLKAISEEIAAGIAKIKAEEEMRRALEEERKFKEDTAHYFFNPIAIAKGYLEIAKEDHNGKAIEKAMHALSRIERVVKNIVERGEIRE